VLGDRVQGGREDLKGEQKVAQLRGNPAA
jgi:hypothetical protein